MMKLGSYPSRLVWADRSDESTIGKTAVISFICSMPGVPVVISANLTCRQCSYSCIDCHNLGAVPWSTRSPSRSAARRV
eukprot:scaffold183020_cov30-Prasinocladus_malaysianus.AAC.1